MGQCCECNPRAGKRQPSTELARYIEQALGVLLTRTAQFERYFSDSIRRRQTCMMRLNVKITKGRLSTVQFVADETDDVDELLRNQDAD